ncbi:unnamed protein product [Wuchereria bancrofti]|uniref:Uncharacterized protein n=1 Tax=Wuchereria bancrofti TaxID=6293 RepID=A0A3P7EFV0_WUCBA|nr:unnamed protein product [Wuchereria bancrofti]
MGGTRRKNYSLLQDYLCTSIVGRRLLLLSQLPLLSPCENVTRPAALPLQYVVVFPQEMLCSEQGILPCAQNPSEYTLVGRLSNVKAVHLHVSNAKYDKQWTD